MRTIAAIACLLTLPALAHPGGLAKDGCHRQRATGTRHCHPDRAQPKPQTEPAAEIVGRASVIDGDTLEIRGQRIRLHGIDAPESRQTCERAGEEWRCGQQASLALSDKIGAGNVTCEQRDRDRYGRVVAVCRASEDLNAWMVREGWALAYRAYSRDYEAQEAEARAAGSGVWVGEFVEPWEWRKR